MNKDKLIIEKLKELIEKQAITIHQADISIGWIRGAKAMRDGKIK